ncbi:MAG: response regulator [Bacteroidota bacterium]
MAEIIIVDSNTEHKKLLTSALRQADILAPCLGFQDGSSILAFFKELLNDNLSTKVNPQYLMVNMILPDMDGLELIQEIRKLKTKEELTIIGYSNEPVEGLIAPAYRNGADLYMFVRNSLPDLVEILGNIFFFLKSRKKKKANPS